MKNLKKIPAEIESWKVPMQDLAENPGLIGIALVDEILATIGNGFKYESFKRNSIERFFAYMDAFRTAIKFSTMCELRIEEDTHSNYIFRLVDTANVRYVFE
jgi:hypothetical protein